MQVLVTMRAPGLAPEELESRVTAPIEIAMRGIPNLIGIRSTTRYSVALMTFEFVDGTDIFWARAQVNERLQEVRDLLPAGADGGLAPIVTPLGEMVMFTIKSETLNTQEMRSLVDWVIRPALRGLPGVADVNVLGGFVAYIRGRPLRAAMAARGITTQVLENAINANNRNDGAGRVRDGEEALLVRSDGRIKTLDDVRNIVVATRGTTDHSGRRRGGRAYRRDAAQWRRHDQRWRDRRSGRWCWACAAPTPKPSSKASRRNSRN